MGPRIAWKLIISEPSRHGISRDFSAVVTLSIVEQSGITPTAAGVSAGDDEQPVSNNVVEIKIEIIFTENPPPL
jgi:hypothetical protein